jgi:hypothetical protein
VIEASGEVVGMTDVGLTGALTGPVDESSGQMSLAQARFVVQQPPPSEAGHDLKPEEQTNVFGADDVLVAAVVVKEGCCELEGLGVAEVVEEGDGTTTTVDEDRAGDGSTLELEGGEVDEGRVVSDGVTITIAVELSKHPPVTHA